MKTSRKYVLVASAALNRVKPTKSRLFALLALFAAVSFTGCKKESDPEPEAGLVFWSKNSAVTTIKVDCYVDGKMIGTLSKVNTTKPDCSDTSLPTTKLTPGKHEWEFRAANGQSFRETIDAVAGNCHTAELL